MSEEESTMSVQVFRGIRLLPVGKRPQANAADDAERAAVPFYRCK
jgi:hypothetical protein